MGGYIKADVLRKEYNDWYKLFLWGDGTDTEKATIARAIQILDEQPTVNVVEKEKFDKIMKRAMIIAMQLHKYQSADVVRVVRCKNCKYRFKNKWFCCDGRCLDDEQFCGFGERGEDE